MEQVKDTRRSQVRITFDGRVFKTFRGHEAAERFANELRVLKHLEEKGCPFVPRVLEADPEKLLLVTTSVGQRVQHLSEAKLAALFEELEKYGVRHEDRDQRNVTYNAADGRFCLIDFEFATLLDDPNHKSPMPWNPKDS
jgi:tRNA A-37 threonylcarbamoyl transferase component Bud32